LTQASRCLQRYIDADLRTGTIEDHAAKLLASRYVEIDIDNDASVEDLEEAHVRLVEKCTQRLLSTYNALRSKPSEDNMDTTPSDSERHQMETQFARTVLFQKLLLKMIRLKPEFSRTARSDSKVGVLEPEAVHQDAIEITYNVASMSGVQSIYMAPDNTLRDLEFRLCASTGFTKIYIIFMGKKLNLDNNGDQTLAEIGMRAKAHLLLQKAPGSETRQPTSNSNAGGSVFEMSILKHFDALFNCMDSDDSISIAVRCAVERDRMFH
jgi:ubiquitin carboxyl-terminal hydrolase 34